MRKILYGADAKKIESKIRQKWSKEFDKEQKVKKKIANKIRGHSLKLKISQAKIRQLAGNISGRVPVRPFSNILTGKPEGDSNGKAV